MKKDQFNSREDLLNEYHNVMDEIYEAKNIKCLRGIKSENELYGRNIITFFDDVNRPGMIKYPECNFEDIFEDLRIISDEIAFFTGQLFLYGPHINNPTKDAFYFEGRHFYPDLQNIHSKIYCMYINCVYEKLYNYWDRIGDLLWIYFQDIVPAKMDYFSNVIKKVPAVYHKSKNYQWLCEVEKEWYKYISEERKKIVHKRSTEIEWRVKHSKYFMDKKEMEATMQERLTMPDFFKMHIDWTLLGFIKTLQFIKEINKVEIDDIL